MTFFPFHQIEKSQGEIYRLRAKLESTQTENENMHDELEKMQQALNRSYADRDKIASDLDKMRDELERSQVRYYYSLLPIRLSIIGGQGLKSQGVAKEVGGGVNCCKLFSVTTRELRKLHYLEERFTAIKDAGRKATRN